MKKTLYLLTSGFLVQASLLAQVPNISYTTPQNYLVEKAINPLIPTNTGGAATYGFDSTFVEGGDDHQGDSPRFYPKDVAVDALGNVYVAEMDDNKTLKISLSGTVNTLAGSGKEGSTDGKGSSASFQRSSRIAVDASGNVYVADNNKIRKVSPSGIVTTLTGSNRWRGDAVEDKVNFAGFSYPKA